MNNDRFLVESDIIEHSQEICSDINDSRLRSRAVSNVCAAKIAVKYFDETSADAESGIHNIPNVLEDYDISDIYVEGNYIDVRLCFSENEMYVPISHFENGVLPLAYMFIMLQDEMSGAEVLGFIFPENINKTPVKQSYYKVLESELRPYFEVESRLQNESVVDIPIEIEKAVYNYLDGKIDLKSELLDYLIKSKTLRELIINAYNVKCMVKDIDFSDNMAAQSSQESPLESEEPAELNTEDTIEGLEESIDFAENNELDLDMENALDIDVDAPFADELEAFSEPDMLNGDIISLDEGNEQEFLEEEAHDLELGINEPAEPTDNPSDNENEETISFTENIVLSDDTGIEISPVSEETVEIPDNTDIADEILPADISGETSDAIDSSAADDFQVINDAETETESETEIAQDVQYDEKSEQEPQTQDDYDSADIDDLSQFDYTTEITPSLETIESTGDSELSGNKVTEEMLDDSSSAFDEENTESDNTENEEINNLFDPNENNTASVNIGNKKKKSPVTLIGLLVLIGALGYFGYNKFTASQLANNSPIQDSTYEESAVAPETSESDKQEGDAMPVESLEEPAVPKKTNEGTAVSIPAIEQNLDASILVSNLTANWEVPSSYTANNTAKRYLVKMGKIIQLRLKTELLLLSKPPITNKIAVELEYNKTSHKFEIKQIIASSGESTVDNVIKTTVNGALDINLGMNMSVFENLQGNPVLVIKL